MQKKLIALIIITLIATGLFAGDYKIAYCDMYKIYNEFPEKVQAEEQFNKEAGQWQQELTDMEQEIAQLQEEYDNLPPMVTEKRKEEKMALINQRQREYYQKAELLRNKALERQNELIKPISDKIVNAINTVAEDYGYDMVLNSMQGESILYAKPEHDITQLVMDKLDEESGK
ncbi:MAG: OmpH family outer membrane protein [Candidatus Cloacimonadota bacterium]|nr:OmpH family outer membrane protein [Candidatus Cloacimonadota bacterium]